MPHVHKYAEEYHDSGIKFCAMNTTKARRLAIAQQILGLPVMAIYQNGEKIDVLVKEECTPETILEMIKRHI